MTALVRLKVLRIEYEQHQNCNSEKNRQEEAPSSLGKRKSNGWNPISPSDVKNLRVTVTSIGQKGDKKEVYMRIQTFLLSYSSWLKL